jgi:teichuronic acid exporter
MGGFLRRNVLVDRKPDTAENPLPTKPRQSTAPPEKHSSLATNLAWRTLANWTSQLVSWAALMVVVRLLSPADFGLVGMSVILYWYLKFLGQFGLTQTVIRHRELSQEQLAQLNTMGVVFGLGSFLLACLFVWPAALFFKTPGVVPVAVVICIGLIPIGVRSVPEGLLNQEMRLKTISLLDALRDIFSAVITVLLAWLGFRYWALVLGNLLPDVLRCAVILIMRPCRFSWPRLAIIREPLLFGWRVLISGFAWSTYNTLDNVTAGRVLGRSALGLYGMAWTLANTPLEKIVSLVTTLVPAYFSRVQNDFPALRRYVWSLTEAIALFTFPTTIGLMLVAHEAIPLVMGQKWNGMVAPLQVLCVYTTIRSIIAILPKVLTTVGKARFVMRVEVSGLVLMPIAFWIGSHWGISGIAYGWIAAYPILALAEYWKMIKTIEMKASDYLRALRPALDGCAAMILAILGLKWVLHPAHGGWSRLSLEVAVGAAVYISTILLLHPSRARHFLGIARRIRGPKLDPEAAVAGS